jgi:hypothetical protein
VRKAHLTPRDGHLTKLTAKDWDFVVSFVRACRSYATHVGEPLAAEDTDLDRWDARHLRALHMRASTRRLPAAPPTLSGREAELAALTAFAGDMGRSAVW